jgi:hypothetical protein
MIKKSITVLIYHRYEVLNIINLTTLRLLSTSTRDITMGYGSRMVRASQSSTHLCGLLKNQN